MFKLAVLATLLALASAKPAVILPYSAGVVSVAPAGYPYHPSTTLIGAAGLPLDTNYHPQVITYHGIQKRDTFTPLAYSAITPVVGTYPKPLISTYSAPYIAPIHAGIVPPTSYVHHW